MGIHQGLLDSLEILIESHGYLKEDQTKALFNALLVSENKFAQDGHELNEVTLFEVLTTCDLRSV